MPYSTSPGEENHVPSVALIGSFRKHYQQILLARNVFQVRGITVTSPLGNAVVDENVLFVRFDTEFEGEDDPTVQGYALHRIMRADAVYVVIPTGYIGRTTCYEVGRVVQAARPVYFSDAPHDLPLQVPNRFVVSPEQLADLILAPGRSLSTLHAEGNDQCSVLERRLLAGDFVQD